MSPGKIKNTAIQIVPYDQFDTNQQAQVSTFLATHPHNTIFQSPEMFTFYTRVNKFFPYYYIAIHNNTIAGILLAVVIKEYNGPLGFLTSRTVVYGGPLISMESTSQRIILDLLLKSLVKKVGKSTMFIQFRNFFSWNEDEIAVFAQHGFTLRDRLNLLIETTSDEEMLARMKENRRRQIGKGLKQGDEIRPPKNETEVKELYKLLADLYKNKVRKPLPPWSFFSNFYQMSQQGKLGIIRVVVSNDKVIGGIISPVTPEQTIYEWYVVGLDREYPQHYPSVLATWTAMQYASNSQVKQFDLMGLGKPEEPYGVRDFKLRFGGKIVHHGRFGRRNHKHLYHLVEITYNLLRHLKKV